MPSSKKKLLRWAPLSAACEQGRVFLVKGAWNQDFVDELEGCKGEDEKNDQADAASGALEALRLPTGAITSASDFKTINKELDSRVVETRLPADSFRM